MTIGRATWEPGWRWSVDVGSGLGASRCNVEHVGLVLSGCATAAMDEGTIYELRAWHTLFRFRPGLMVTIVGAAAIRRTSLHFMGATAYSKDDAS
jgi:hypothetical protein